MDRSITTVLGQTGAGKTYRIQESIIPAMPTPGFIVDPMHEYDMGVIYEAKDSPRNNPVRLFRRLYIEQQKTTQYDWHVIRPTTESADKYKTQALDAIRILHALKMPGTYIIDEADIYGNARKASQPLEDMVLRGRHNKVNLVFAARRITNISKTIVSQSHVVISFHQNLDIDVRRFKDMFGDRAAKTVSELGTYEYVAVGSRVEDVPYYSQLNPVNKTR